MVGFPTLGNKAFQGEPGAHNGIRAEGKRRSVQQPCKRLKFENILTVVPLLFLALTRIASLTDYNISKVAKIIVRHKIVSLGPKDMYPSSHQLQKSRRESSFHEWKRPRGLLAWLWSGWIEYIVVQHFSRSVTISFLFFTTNGVLVLAFLFFCPLWSLRSRVYTCLRTS